MIVITGFQDCVDIAAARAAKSLGIATAGYMTRGFMTISGPKPHYKELYGAIELNTDDYAERTALNVKMAEGIILFPPFDSRGARCVYNNNVKPERPLFKCDFGKTVGEVREFIDSNEISSLMIGGPRSSPKLNFELRVETFLKAVLRPYSAIDGIS